MAQLPCGGMEEAAKVSLPIPVGLATNCIPGGEKANSPIRTRLLSCLFAEANHRWPFSHSPVSDENAQRCPLAPGPWEPSSRSTNTPSRGPVTQSQTPGQEQVNGERQGLPTCRVLTHLHADLTNGPGGIVADRDELRVQVGAQDGHELSWWRERRV